MSIDEESSEQIWREFWISLASLLRSYTALHGLNGKHQPTVEEDEEHITVRHGNNCLNLARRAATVSWKREDGRTGSLEFTEAGQLRGPAGEEEMDMAAEQWARDLMRGRSNE